MFGEFYEDCGDWVFSEMCFVVWIEVWVVEVLDGVGVIIVGGDV